VVKKAKVYSGKDLIAQHKARGAADANAVAEKEADAVETEVDKAAKVWGNPPDRGDTTPRHEPGTGREQSRNTPLGG